MDKIELIKRMINLNPNDSNTWYLLGLEYAENNDISEALKAYSEALKHCDDNLKADIINALTNLSLKSNLSNSSQENQNKDIEILNIQSDNSDSNENNDNGLNEIQIDESDNTTNNIVPLRVIQGQRNNKISLDADKKKNITFDDVGGLDDLKETIRMKIIKPFSTPGIFEKFKKKSGGGILLFGPPGCGKTFIAKATAGECKANFIPVHITDILDPYLGASSRNIKDVFNEARAKKPCVLFFDEIDTIGYNRAKLSSEHMRPIIDQLLTELEGIESNNDKVLIIGATNMPWDVDPALKRPGRFDKMIFAMPPDINARKEIFALKLKDRPLDEIDYAVLAKRTELYSGADIENVVELATENVISSIMNTGVERQINMNDLLYAIDKTAPSTIDWLKTIETYIKYGNIQGLFSDVEIYLKKYKKYLGGTGY